MPVSGVTNGDTITEAWGDSVATSVNALEAADTAHAAAANPHPVYALDTDLTTHAAAADPHAGYQKESEKAAANGYASLDAGGKVPAAQLGLLHTINYVIDGGGAVITTGIKGDLICDFAGTIQKWTLLADQSGSIVVDIWRDTYANYPPVVGDVITASAKPTISAATKGQSSTLTGWSTGITAGDVLRFNVNSAATVQRVTIALTVLRT